MAKFIGFFRKLNKKLNIRDRSTTTFDQRDQRVATQYNIAGDLVLPLPPAEIEIGDALVILLKNVETTWIRGVLEKSMHQMAFLDLGIEIRADAVDHPWRTVLGAPNQLGRPLSPGKNIKEIFDESNRLLLILGNAGSGKTTTLLQLTRQLIEEAKQEPGFTHPVPVIFNLSTWNDPQQPLDDWLIAELKSKYRAPKKLGRRLLEERRILPLLDGLDEVKRENRASCVEKINRLAVDYGLHGMVVCCRNEDYTTLGVRLEFNNAIYLQPLTEAQINQYFEESGDELAGLWATLQQDEVLQSMAQSPLMLNIMSLAYPDTAVKELSEPALRADEIHRKQLFDRYIARMFKRRGHKGPYDQLQTQKRLAWLAQNMQRHNQEVFLIEDLQPSWLLWPRWRWLYILASRLSGGLIIGLLVGLSFGLNEWLIHQMSSGALSWLILGLLFGLSFGLSIGFVDLLRLEWFNNWKWIETKKSLTIWWPTLNVVVVGLVVGLTGGLSFGLSVELILERSVRLSFGLIIGLIWGLIFGLRGSRQSLTNDIQTVEALLWSWRRVLRGGLIVGVIVGLGFGLIVGLIDGLSDGLVGGLIGGVIGAIFYGLNRGIIETKTAPNQGIRLSARNAVFGGAIVGLLGGVSDLLIFGLSDLLIWNSFELFFRLGEGLIVGLFVGLLGALWYGGLDIIQHYILRTILLFQGHTPRNYARFLDFATECIFLQKAGGGYRYIHRLLLEHFAALEPEEGNIRPSF